MARRRLAHAIDADMAGLDQRGRAAAGFDHPRVPQPFIETLALQTTPFRPGRLWLENALAILAVGGELLLERSQFGKRRIGVDRTLALARGRAGRVLPVRRPALGAFITATFFAAALVAPTRKFALGPVVFPALVVIPAFALEALARFANRRAIGGGLRNGFGRRVGAGFAELVVTLAPSAPLALAFIGGLAGLACGRGGGGGPRGPAPVGGGGWGVARPGRALAP